MQKLFKLNLILNFKKKSENVFVTIDFKFICFPNLSKYQRSLQPSHFHKHLFKIVILELLVLRKTLPQLTLICRISFWQFTALRKVQYKHVSNDNQVKAGFIQCDIFLKNDSLVIHFLRFQIRFQINSFLIFFIDNSSSHN